MSAGDLWPTLRFREMLVDGTVAGLDWLSMTIKLALMKASLTAYVDNSHLADLSYYGSVTAEEATVDGVAGGKLLTTKSVTTSLSFAIMKAGAATFSSTSSGGTTARWAILYRDTGTPATSPIIAILDLGSDRALTGASNSTPLTVTFTNSKVLKFSGTGTPALA